MKITAKLSEGVLTLALPSRIDTTNASEVEEGLKKAIEAHQGFEELNLDAKGLEYISSVGLRVLLRLRRAHGDMMVTEVKPEVYDIFEMTGFTEMMEVRKGYRTISIEGCPLIGEGYFGKVYRISPDAIVKMYFRTPGPEMSIKERSRAKMAFVLGIPTAISYEVVRIAGTENTFGSVFELVDAKSMDSIMKKEPNRIKEMEDVYCNLLKTISATKV
ncbi:MAG: anti-sigma factor antagonist, partial [Bacilli bacterium]|nr:anti-sigma factor antagonist [Bacilli bacterium]